MALLTEKEVRESQEAENILKSEVFKLAIQNLEKEYIAHWKNSNKLEDVTWREDLHRAISLLPEIERHLRIIIEKGKLTKTNIQKIRNSL